MGNPLDDIKNFFNGIKSFFEGLGPFFSKIKSFFEGLGPFFVTIWDTLKQLYPVFQGIWLFFTYVYYMIVDFYYKGVAYFKYIIPLFPSIIIMFFGIYSGLPAAFENITKVSLNMPQIIVLFFTVYIVGYLLQYYGESIKETQNTVGLSNKMRTLYNNGRRVFPLIIFITFLIMNYLASFIGDTIGMESLTFPPIILLFLSFYFITTLMESNIDFMEGIQSWSLIGNAFTGLFQNISLLPIIFNLFIVFVMLIQSGFNYADMESYGTPTVLTILALYLVGLLNYYLTSLVEMLQSYLLYIYVLVILGLLISKSINIYDENFNKKKLNCEKDSVLRKFNDFIDKTRKHDTRKLNDYCCKTDNLNLEPNDAKIYLSSFGNLCENEIKIIEDKISEATNVPSKVDTSNGDETTDATQQGGLLLYHNGGYDALYKLNNNNSNDFVRNNLGYIIIITTGILSLMTNKKSLEKFKNHKQKQD